MSKRALKAFNLLRVRPRLDGTSRLVVFKLCYHFNDMKGFAWPSIGRMADDLDLAKSTVRDALDRLELGGIIRRSSGRGRGNSTHYMLPFISQYELAVERSEPIIVIRKAAGPPRISKDKHGKFASKEKGAVDREIKGRSTVAKAPAHRGESLRSTDTEKKKTIKKEPARAVNGTAGAPKTLSDIAFDKQHELNRIQEQQHND